MLCLFMQATKAAAELADPEADEDRPSPRGNAADEAAAADVADEDAAEAADEDEEAEEEEVIMLQVCITLVFFKLKVPHPVFCGCRAYL